MASAELPACPPPPTLPPPPLDDVGLAVFRSAEPPGEIFSTIPPIAHPIPRVSLEQGYGLVDLRFSQILL